jgi:acetylglutamate synthase
MSQASRIAVVAAMQADAALVALLAADPDSLTTPPAAAIFNAYKDQAPPVYPCLTYRISTGAPDHRFRPSRAAGGGPATVKDEYFDLEAWSKTPDSAPIEAIGARLTVLFDGASLALTGGGSIFWSELVTYQPDLYDDDLNAHYGLFRFRIRASTT